MAEGLVNQGRQAVERFAAVNRRQTQQNAHARRQAQHGVSSNTVRRSRTTPAATPTGTRSRRPLARTTSTDGSAGPVGAAWTVNGANLTAAASATGGASSSRWA